MVDVLQAAQLTIQAVESKFGLRAETDPAFLAEFDVPAVALSEYQKQVLDQAQANFKYLMAYLMQEEPFVSHSLFLDAETICTMLSAF